MAAQDPSVSTESNGSALVYASITLLILTWLSVFLRTYVRAIMLKGFQADDWLMLISQDTKTRIQAIFTVSCSFILVGVYYGLGRHNKSLDQFDEIQALAYQALATASYVLDMMFIKLSIGIFLLRLATQKRYKYTIYASLAIIAVWSLVLFFWNLFQCHPVQAQWDYTILANDPNAGCVSADEVVSAAYALSVMTILSDWMYALIPIPIVWNVKMTLQAKMTVVLILGLGVFASIATLIRLKFLADLIDTADILFAGTDAMVWTLVEPGVAIIASSLVTIRPLLRAWKIHGFGSTGASKNYGTYGFGGSSGIPASGTNRSKKSCAMPGFGSRDLELMSDDVEMGRSSKNSSLKSDFGTSTSKSGLSTHLSRISERLSGILELSDEPPKSEGSKYADGVTRTIGIRTESFIMDGGQLMSPSPTSPDVGSGNRSPGSPRYQTALRTPPKSWFAKNTPSASLMELPAKTQGHGRGDGRTGLEPANQI